MSSKPGNSGRIARRVISLVSARLRLLFVPVLIAWALLGVGLGAVQQAQAQSRDEDSGGGVRHIVVTLYKSRTLMLEQPFASAVVGSPDIVDALPMSDRRLYIQGKKAWDYQRFGIRSEHAADRRDRRGGHPGHRQSPGKDSCEHRQQRHPRWQQQRPDRAQRRSPAIRWPPTAPWRWLRPWCPKVAS